MKQLLFNIHDVVLIMTISQCLLLAFLQGLSPAINRQSNALIAGFFALTALSGVSILLFWSEKMQAYGFREGYFLPALLTMSAMLTGPALYLYFASITMPNFRLVQRRNILHLIPCVFILFVVFGFGVTGHNLYLVDGVVMNQVTLFIWTSFKLSPMLYSLICIYLLRNIDHSLMGYFSDGGEVGAVWAKVLVYGFLAHYFWSFLVHILGYFGGVQVFDGFGVLDNYLTFLLVNLLFIYGLLYSRHLALASVTAQGQKIKKTDSRAANAETLLEGLSEKNITAVMQGIEGQKLYLEHNITVEQFAKRVGLSSRDASQVINSHYQSNFFEFINKYRVEEAKSILTSPEHRKLTVLDVLHMSGFNSKSAFHRFFKRMTGVSPTQYRKNAIK